MKMKKNYNNFICKDFFINNRITFKDNYKY